MASMRLSPFVRFAAPGFEAAVEFEAHLDATAKSLFQRPQDEHPGEFTDGQLRTLQRRVKQWRQIMAKKLSKG